MEKIIQSLKYIPKIWTALSFILLLVTSMILFFGRNFESLRINCLIDAIPDFYLHVSNFSISFLILITIGYVGLMAGMTIKHIVILSILIALLNLIIESYIPILNTPDPLDAIFGIVAAILGLIYLILAKKYGMKKNEL